MNITMTLIVVFVLLAATLFFVTVRNRRRHAAAYRVKPLDLKAFHSLLDRDDEIFLKQKLARREFSHLKRRRIGVTWKYVRRISDNSKVVIRQAGEIRQDAVPEVALAATQVADQATQIRMQCIKACTKLAVEFAFPSLQLTPAVLEPRYESLRASVMRLGTLRPQKMAPLAAAI
jgi:hypothetical protein